jgi:hypothetical protein
MAEQMEEDVPDHYFGEQGAFTGLWAYGPSKPHCNKGFPLDVYKLKPSSSMSLQAQPSK